MTNTVLGLFRHGQTDWNIDLRLQGTADIPMNEFGFAQVRTASEKLAQIEWDVLLTSPLTRAKQTASLVAEKLGIQEAVESSLLIERSFGIGEGKTYAEWQSHYSQLDEIPGAESQASVRERSQQLLEFIAGEFAGARVLAVSHGALIRFVLDVVTEGELPPKGERLQNASLHTLRHGELWVADGWAPEPLA
jgi:broad specificity phosphatase PhoE